ncbi:hypothetical protein ACIP10_26805 [Streptomyces galbus]|uniref:hypothetical protein n=1 Tax=Streptomyces galbus TaxID=33898 RepID=UPI0037AC2974
MPQMSKVELYAAIRRDHRGGMSMRELERKHGVTWRTVRKALDSATARCESYRQQDDLALMQARCEELTDLLDGREAR